MGPTCSTDTSGPLVSVVIPAYRGLATIEQCLASVERATAAMTHEITVVESSADGTAAFLRRRFPAVQVITSPCRLSAGQARNVGIQHSRGRFLLCVDQDCIVPPDWTERLVALLQQSGVGAAGGSMAVANPRNLSGWCVYYLEFFTHVPCKRAPRFDNFLIGANSGWRAEVLRSCPFPDQTLGEDLLLSETVRRQGYTVVYDPTLSVWHHNRQGWGEFLRYCRAMGQAAATSRSRLGGGAIGLLQRLPILTFAIPLIMLPTIGWRLAQGPRGYLMRFVLLFPCCLMGQLAWAAAFHRTLLQRRTFVPAIGNPTSVIG